MNHQATGDFLFLIFVGLCDFIFLFLWSHKILFFYFYDLLSFYKVINFYKLPENY